MAEVSLCCTAIAAHSPTLIPCDRGSCVVASTSKPGGRTATTNMMIYRFEMTPQQLIQECEDAINHKIMGGSDAKISLVLKGSFTNSGRKKLWNGKGAPIGQCLSEVADNRVLVLFKAQEVIDAIKKQEDDRS